MTSVPDEFVRPSFPPVFVLIDEDGQQLGPFRRDQLIWEPDGAFVIYEDGASPARFGVVRIDGDLLRLFPNGTVRLRAVGKPT